MSLWVGQTRNWGWIRGFLPPAARQTSRTQLQKQMSSTSAHIGPLDDDTCSRSWVLLVCRNYTQEHQQVGTAWLKNSV
jgi:hypothetical protein